MRENEENACSQNENNEHSDMDEPANDNSFFSFLSYNINGLSQCLDSGLFSYIRDFHFVCLVETFCAYVSDHYFPGFEMFFAPALKLSQDTTGRLSGGVIMLVKKELCRHVERIHLEYDNMVALKISKNLLSTKSDVILLGVYIPPANSKYYSDTNIYNGIAMLEECMLHIYETIGDLPFILLGDLNARTGSENVDVGDTYDDLQYSPLTTCSLTTNFGYNEQKNISQPKVLFIMTKNSSVSTCSLTTNPRLQRASFCFPRT